MVEGFENFGEGLGCGGENDVVEGVGVERLFGTDVDGPDVSLIGDVDDRIGDAMREGVRLPGACAGDDEQWSAGFPVVKTDAMFDGRALPVIQFSRCAAAIPEFPLINNDHRVWKAEPRSIVPRGTNQNLYPHAPDRLLTPS